MTRILVAVALLLLVATASAAQTVLNPNYVEFAPSPDHAVVVSGVGPLVESYELRFYASGATAPQQTSNLGKPTPNAQNLCVVDIASTIIAFPISPTTSYTARLVASGVAGASPESAPSNSFLRVAPPQAAGAATFVRR